MARSVTKREKASLDLCRYKKVIDIFKETGMNAVFCVNHPKSEYKLIGCGEYSA